MLRSGLFKLAKVAAVLSALAFAATFVFYRTTGTLPGGARIADLLGYRAEAAVPIPVSEPAASQESVSPGTLILMSGSKSYTGGSRILFNNESTTTRTPAQAAVSSPTMPSSAPTKAQEKYIRAQVFPLGSREAWSSSKYSTIARPSDFRVDTASGTVILQTRETETVPLPSERQVFSSSKGGILLSAEDLQPQGVPKGAPPTQIFVPLLSRPTSSIDSQVVLQGGGTAPRKPILEAPTPVGPPEANHHLYFPSLPMLEIEEPAAELTPEQIKRLAEAILEAEQDRPKP